MSIQIIPTNQFDAQFAIGVRREAASKITKKIIGSVGAIKKSVGEVLVVIFRNTPVVQGLTGGGAVDLQAHLGLRPGEGSSFAAGMQNVILDEINITTSNDPNKIIKLTAIDASYSRMIVLPGASHTNQQTGTTVPVGEWILVDPDIDIGQAAFDIVFKGGEGGKFDKAIQQGSRSGRAIMVALQSLGGGPGYVLPAVVRGDGGKNFIEVAMQTQKVADRIGQIILRRLGA